MLDGSFLFSPPALTTLLQKLQVTHMVKLGGETAVAQDLSSLSEFI